MSMIIGVKVTDKQCNVFGVQFSLVKSIWKGGEMRKWLLEFLRSSSRNLKAFMLFVSESDICNLVFISPNKLPPFNQKGK